MATKTKSTPQKSRPQTKAKQVKTRKLKPAHYKTFRLQKRIKHPVKLPSVYRIARLSLATIWDHKLVLGGIILIHGLLTLILVQGAAGTNDVSDLKQLLSEAFGGSFASLATGASIFALLVGSAGNTAGGASSVYQLLLALITSLAIIWSLRQALAGKHFGVRDAFYRGMYPLVPFILVLLVIGIQTIPAIIGSSLYSIVVGNGIAVLPAEKLLWATFYLLLALLSLYMITSSLFAAYIVTLPNMTPLKALRSARELVRYRRWTVLRKLLGLPFVLLTAAALLMLPIIIWLTPIAEAAFFVLTMFSLLAVHAYVYTLYRELLNE